MNFSIEDFIKEPNICPFLNYVFRLKRQYDREEGNSERVVTIVSCLPGLKSSLSIMAKPLNRNPCSLTLLSVVRPDTHPGCHYVTQAPAEGFVIDGKPRDCSGDISRNKNVVERPQWLLDLQYRACTRSEWDFHQSLRDHHIARLSLYKLGKMSRVLRLPTRHLRHLRRRLQRY